MFSVNTADIFIYYFETCFDHWKYNVTSTLKTPVDIGISRCAYVELADPKMPLAQEGQEVESGHIVVQQRQEVSTRALFPLELSDQKQVQKAPRPTWRGQLCYMYDER